MKLVTFLRRSGTVDCTIAPEGAEAMRREWDQLRDAAGSEAERSEIDAIFCRVMP